MAIWPSIGDDIDGATTIADAGVRAKDDGFPCPLLRCAQQLSCDRQ